MDINQMTRKQFEALPWRKSFDGDVICDSIVILPTRRLHDSGYRCMDFVAVKANEAICRLSGCSDVIHVEGIGGLGDDWLEKYHTVPDLIPPSGWSIDCLNKSGLLRMFPSSNSMKAGAALSSFEIFALPKSKKAGSND